MPQYDDDLDLDDELTGSDLVKDLRKQLNAAKRDLAAAQNQISELTLVSRESSIGSMLEGFGLSKRIARYVADDVETEDDLVEWLEEYGEDFGIVPEASYDDPDALEQQRMSAAEEGGYDPTAGYDVIAQIEAAQSPEELLAFLRSTG